MKKIMCSILFLSGFALAGSAQTVNTKQKTHSTQHATTSGTHTMTTRSGTVQDNGGNALPGTMNTPATNPRIATRPATSGNGPKKENGMPDMRYKENQQSAKGHNRKDVTAHHGHKGDKKS